MISTDDDCPVTSLPLHFSPDCIAEKRTSSSPNVKVKWLHSAFRAAAVTALRMGRNLLNLYPVSSVQLQLFYAIFFRCGDMKEGQAHSYVRNFETAFFRFVLISFYKSISTCTWKTEHYYYAVFTASSVLACCCFVLNMTPNNMSSLLSGYPWDSLFVLTHYNLFHGGNSSHDSKWRQSLA